MSHYEKTILRGGEALHLRRHGVREAIEAALRHLAPRDRAATAQRLRGRGTTRQREEQRRDERVASSDLPRARARLAVRLRVSVWGGGSWSVRVYVKHRPREPCQPRRRQ